MITEIGHLSLILALLVSVLQIGVLGVGYTKKIFNWLYAGTLIAVVQFGFIGISFLSITWAFVNSDFSLALVTNNSHTLKPLLYKISGVWGNHEGSMLLWVLVLSFFGFLLAVLQRQIPLRIKALVLFFQSAITLAFLSFILFTSNPFDRLEFPPFNGYDLNPLLQDPGLAFHPPLLYLGYVGLSISFSFALAGLANGNINSAWASWVRPWTLLSWVFLTLGIALGSWWAYYELGWGGWWFWDPVENASFMPWLITTALLHSTLVLEKREQLAKWTVLLSILAFSLSLIGTFLVRSGIITSVHSFASDPTRGIYILAIMLLFTGGAFALYLLLGRKIRGGLVFSFWSRESTLISNNFLLVISAMVVFIGTFWPLIIETIHGDKISVGPPYFNLTFTPFMIALSLLLPIGVSLAWKRGNISRALKSLIAPAILALVLAILILSLQTGMRMLGPVGLMLAAWIIFGTLWELAVKVGFGKHPVGKSLRWLKLLPRTEYGKSMAHLGFGFTIIGIASITSWEIEDIRVVQIGDTYQVGSYEFQLLDVKEIRGPNYFAQMGEFEVFQDNSLEARMFPEKRVYPVASTTTTEAAIDMGLLRDLYIVLGDFQGENAWAVRTYIKPMVNWIWIGAFVMALGGCISLSARFPALRSSVLRKVS